MAIRNAAKAIVLHNDRLLLNKCSGKTGRIYYDLPGGGQNPYETMEQAVIREVLEETGFLVSVVRFAAVCEEIFLSEEVRMLHPDYSHRVFHVFICKLTDASPKEPTEADFDQLESVWTSPNDAISLPVRPTAIRYCSH